MTDKKIKNLSQQIQELEKQKADLTAKKSKEISSFIEHIGLMEMDMNLLLGVLMETKNNLLQLTEGEKNNLKKEGQKHKKLFSSKNKKAKS